MAQDDMAGSQEGQTQQQRVCTDLPEWLISRAMTPAVAACDIYSQLPRNPAVPTKSFFHSTVISTLQISFLERLSINPCKYSKLTGESSEQPTPADPAETEEFV